VDALTQEFGLTATINTATQRNYLESMAWNWSVRFCCASAQILDGHEVQGMVPAYLACIPERKLQQHLPMSLVSVGCMCRERGSPAKLSFCIPQWCPGQEPAIKVRLCLSSKMAWVWIILS
jgi:hypothetical protein